MEIKVFQFNHFSQNTYVLHDETREAAIVDPGCYFEDEEKTLGDFILKEQLTVKKLIFTHCHLDHVFGAAFATTLGKDISLEAHQAESIILEKFPQFTASFGISAGQPPELTRFINDGDSVTFGITSLAAIHVPGHSPGGICFYNAQDSTLISGDVLFRGSIGRSDLPGGNPDELTRCIRERLLPLPGNCIVYPGHGPTTTIGHERTSNPFLINC